jgi:hypothetical protein
MILRDTQGGALYRRSHEIAEGRAQDGPDRYWVIISSEVALILRAWALTNGMVKLSG